MTMQTLKDLCSALGLLLRGAFFVAVAWYGLRDIKRYLDQREDMVKIDYAWKQAQFVLEQSKVRCEGP